MNKVNTVRLVSLLMVLAMLPTVCFAEGYFGVLGGLTIPTGVSGAKNAFTWGVRLGGVAYETKVEKLDVGIFYGNMSISETDSGITATATNQMIAAEILGRRMWGTPIVMGARTGIGISTLTLEDLTTSASASGTRFYVAPVLGLDFSAGDVMIGIDASYYTLTSTTISGSGVSASVGSANGFSLLGSIRFGF